MESEYKIQLKKITESYTFKILFLAFLILMLLIPLMMVRSIITERSRTADSAKTNIMEAWGR